MSITGIESGKPKHSGVLGALGALGVQFVAVSPGLLQRLQGSEISMIEIALVGTTVGGFLGTSRV